MALFPSRASGAGILSRNLLPLFAMFTGDPGSSDSERCINAQITAYRHVVHGVAPPPVVWQEAAVVQPHPPCSSAESLLEQVTEWDHKLLARLRARQQELRAPPPSLPEPMQVVVSIERQLPSLLLLQRRVWSEVMGHTDGTELCSEAAESLTCRRQRRQRQPRELREAERLERKRQADAVRRPAPRRPAQLAHWNCSGPRRPRRR